MRPAAARPLAALALLAALAAPALAAEPLAGSFTDPADADDGAVDLRRVSWTVSADRATVTLETRGTLNMHEYDYVAALVLGDAEAEAPQEAYYLQQAPQGPVLVARHAPEPDARPQVVTEATRLRFHFPRTLPENATAEAPGCAFAVAGTGRFSGAAPSATLDSAPDTNAGQAEEPWGLRERFCSPPPPPPREAPGFAPVVAAALAAAVALTARRR